MPNCQSGAETSFVGRLIQVTVMDGSLTRHVTGGDLGFWCALLSHLWLESIVDPPINDDQPNAQRFHLPISDVPKPTPMPIFSVGRD